MNATTIRGFGITVDDQEDVVELDVVNGSALKAMQSFVGGYVEAVALDSPSPGRELVAWLNDEGLLTEQLNVVGTMTIANLAQRRLSQPLFGPVLFTASSLEGETLPLDDRELAAIRAAVPA